MICSLLRTDFFTYSVLLLSSLKTPVFSNFFLYLLRALSIDSFSFTFMTNILFTPHFLWGTNLKNIFFFSKAFAKKTTIQQIFLVVAESFYLALRRQEDSMPCSSVPFHGRATSIVQVGLTFCNHTKFKATAS